MPTAKLSWGMGDRLPKATAKSEGERVATGAPLRRVIGRDAVKLALNETALGAEVSSQQRLPRRQSETIYRKAFRVHPGNKAAQALLRQHRMCALNAF